MLDNLKHRDDFVTLIEKIKSLKLSEKDSVMLKTEKKQTETHQERLYYKKHQLVKAELQK